MDTSFSSQITGLYKDPAANILYVATPYNIQKYSGITAQKIININPALDSR
jgi:hypothetical protein